MARVGDRVELAKTKILVNATSIGLTTRRQPIPAELLHAELLVLDLMYAKTRLMRDAKAAAATDADGDPMLLHQTAAAFKLWTGQPAPLPLMQAKLAEGCAGASSDRASPPAGRRGAGGCARVTAFRFLTAGESPHGQALEITR